MNLWYISFILGLGSSLHCAVMCSPIAEWVTGKNAQLAVNPLTRFSLYQGARICVYGILGVLISMLSFKPDLHLIQYSSLVLSILLVVLILAFEQSALKNPLAKPYHKIRSSLLSRTRAARNPYTTSLLAGTLNALLPCTALGFALSLCLQTENTKQGFLMMFVFGLGNIPGFILIPFWKKSGLPIPRILMQSRAWGILLVLVLTFRLGSMLYLDGTEHVLIPGFILCEP